MVKERAQREDIPTNFEPRFTVGEAAAITKMSLAWWRKAIFERKIRHLKIGSRVFVLDSTIRELLTRGLVEPKAEKGGHDVS